MPTVVEHKKYVCTDALNNNNKFWEYFLHDDGSVVVKYGRVGKTCTVDPPKQMSRVELDRKIREKTAGRGKEGTPSYKPPYREIAVVADAVSLPTGPTLANVVVAEAAKSQLLSKTDPTLVKLVERLVASNKHELHKASGGQMDIDLKTGIISTPIGVVTKDSVARARDILTKDLAPLVQSSDFDSKKFIQGVNDYLMLVPQQVGHARGWHRYFIPDLKAMQRQSTLLDQLEASADLAAARVAAAATGQKDASISTVPNLFTAKIKILEDKDIIARITKLFNEHKNDSHESARLRPIAFYEIELPEAKAAYERDGAKLDNQWLLWHGTRMFNVLSILKSGLIIPKSGGSYQITGRMFGDGIYFSDQSTKSLNYSYGFWDGNKRDNNCFMFMADVAMGKYHVPGGGYGMRQIPAGYDSCFAKAGTGGVRNNEMIVYRTSQANLRYLVEFEG
jgi:poly [ADP-ribose] polymerase